MDNVGFENAAVETRRTIRIRARKSKGLTSFKIHLTRVVNMCLSVLVLVPSVVDAAYLSVCISPSLFVFNRSLQFNPAGTRIIKNGQIHVNICRNLDNQDPE